MKVELQGEHLTSKHKLKQHAAMIEYHMAGYKLREIAVFFCVTETTASNVVSKYYQKPTKNLILKSKV